MPNMAVQWDFFHLAGDNRHFHGAFVCTDNATTRTAELLSYAGVRELAMGDRGPLDQASFFFSLIRLIIFAGSTTVRDCPFSSIPRRHPAGFEIG